MSELGVAGSNPAVVWLETSQKPARSKAETRIQSGGVGPELSQAHLKTLQIHKHHCPTGETADARNTLTHADGNIPSLISGGAF